jgi:hypothetical protein
MDNAQNRDSYINILSSQIYRSEVCRLEYGDICFQLIQYGELRNALRLSQT